MCYDEPGILERQWWVSCVRCSDSLRAHGPTKANAQADLRGQGWKMKEGAWICPKCIGELNPPKARKLELHSPGGAMVRVIVQPAGHGRYHITKEQLMRVKRAIGSTVWNVTDLEGNDWDRRPYNGGYMLEPMEVDCV